MPVESVDDDLLTLESAAVLSLLSKYRVANLYSAIEKWQQVPLTHHGNAHETDAVEHAATVLQTLLESTGLVLPSALDGRRLSFKTVTTEMTAIVQGPFGCENGPHASVALLNIACKDSYKGHGAAAGLLGSDLILRAWKHIVRFVNRLRSKTKPGSAPVLIKPVSDDWIAHDKDLVGDGTPWSLGIGPMFHTLAGWDSAWLMGQGAMKDEQWNAISYWTPLPHLALGPLGWSDPAVGVARWILLGMPGGTPELSLLARVWGVDALMYFSHWQMDWVPQSYGASGLNHEKSGHKLSRIFQQSESAADYGRCGELHMQEHLMWQMFNPAQRERASPHIYGEKGAPGPARFVLELGGSAGWRSELETAGQKLWAEFRDPHMQVTVLAPPIGTLGTFRRSLITQNWYSGSHEAHLLGYSASSATSTWPLPVRSTAADPDQASSHATASAFWLASELGRRHPEYVLHGDQPAEGSGLRLLSSTAPAIRISRSGAFRAEGMVYSKAAGFLESQDKRALIRSVEREIGLSVPVQSAPTTKRTIVYRAMAHVLALTAGEKARWDFLAVDDMPSGSVWQLSCEGKPLATFLPDGDVLQPHGTANLLDRYNANSRRLSATIGDVLGSALP